MSDKTSIETVAIHLKKGLTLLEQLHVLSQTQTLLLESGDLVKLGAIVDAKEAVVARITENETQLTSMLANGEPEWSSDPLLVALKKQALHLIERISDVERKNRELLEALRARLIQRSEAVKQDRIIHETYGNLS
jgi:FlgN protein